MTKKSFAGGLDSLLNSSFEEEKKIDPLSNKNSKLQKTPKKEKALSKKTKKNENLEIEDRYTLYLKKENVEKMQALAWWERRSIKDVANEALDTYFEKKGTKHINHAINEFTKAKS